jgi:hypothetical protein
VRVCSGMPGALAARACARLLFICVSCLRASEIAGSEAFQPDHIASSAGCISNELAFAIELRDFK